MYKTMPYDFYTSQGLKINKQNGDTFVKKKLELDEFHLFRKLLDQDITYATVWDKSVYEQTIEKMFKQIKFLSLSRKPDKLRQKRALIQKYESFNRRLYYDHKTVRDDNGNIVEAQQLERKDDRITTQGLARMSEIFTGETAPNYLYPIYGSSRISAELGDWRLYEELATTSILDAGYASGSGTIIKHGASFSINEPSNDAIYEFAVRDFPAFNEYQTVFFRSVLEHPVSHTQGQDVIIIAHAAYLVSVADFEEQVNDQVI